MPYMTYTQLKNSAKARIAPVMGKLVGITAAYIGLTVLVSQVASLPALAMGSPVLQLALTFLCSMISGVLSTFIMSGIYYVYLKLYCGRPIAVSDMFHAFTAQTKTCFLLSLVMNLLYLLPYLPAYYFSAQVSTAMQQMTLDALSSNINPADVSMPPELMRAMTLMLFSITPALILITILGLVYSQAYYLMWDFPSLSVRELLRQSRRLMRGHKGRLFYVRVCFIPVTLLGMLTCGIGMLWIAPFLYAVQAEFYLDLVTKRSL